MRVGDLNKRIEVDCPKAPPDTDTETNEELPVWVPYDVVWGKIEPARGREKLAAAGGTIAPFDAQITMRWSQNMDALRPTWRLRHRGVVYNIVSIANVNLRDREIEVLATAGANDG